MKRTIRVVILTVAVAVAGLPYAGDALAEQPSRVLISGNANPVPVAGNPCLLTNVESGTGHGLHLGALTWASEERVDFCVVPPKGVVTGHFTLTAANGDVVQGTYTTLADLDQATVTVNAVGTYELTGGTGRFVGVGGRGEIRASGSLVPPFEVTGSLVGTMN